MVTAYWSIGKLIVEHEQKGDERAEYGKAVLEGLAERLTVDFGTIRRLLGMEICEISRKLGIVYFPCMAEPNNTATKT